MYSDKVLKTLERQFEDTVKQRGQVTHWIELLKRISRAIDECQGVVMEIERELGERRRDAVPLPRVESVEELQARARTEFAAVKGLQLLRQRVLGRLNELDPRFDPSTVR